jgi:outer membrane murein-binding lipoprotein Lpp
MRREPRLATVILLLALAGCGTSGQGGTRVTACEQATALDRRMAADREAARTSLDASGGYAGTGEQAKPDEVARRTQELNAKLAAEERQLAELRSKCLGGASP